jgi:hypothetical protein
MSIATTREAHIESENSFWLFRKSVGNNFQKYFAHCSDGRIVVATLLSRPSKFNVESDPMAFERLYRSIAADGQKIYGFKGDQSPLPIPKKIEAYFADMEKALEEKELEAKKTKAAIEKLRLNPPQGSKWIDENGEILTFLEWSEKFTPIFLTKDGSRKNGNAMYWYEPSAIES